MFQQLGNCYCSCYHKFSFHIVCRHTGYTCAGFSKRSTRLLHWSFNAPLVHYPGLTLFWDGFAILTPIAFVMNMVCHCLKHEQSCLKEKLMNQMEFVFLLCPLVYERHPHFLPWVVRYETFFWKNLIRVMKKMNKQCHVYNKMNWDTLDEDKKLTFLLPKLWSQKLPPKEQTPKGAPPKEQRRW